jgi:hypothetical protein
MMQFNALIDRFINMYLTTSLHPVLNAHYYLILLVVMVLSVYLI